MLESVDNALRLVQMLRDVGALRLTDAARELGIAPSTAHRLLAMLVYRGFAVQDEKRVYHPGPALEAVPAQKDWTRAFADRCRPFLETLAEQVGETVNLVIRVGTQVRFLWSAEADRPLGVGDRRGQVLDAELTAGGRILLAELPRDALERLYLRPEESAPEQLPWGDRRLPPPEFERFRRDLAAAAAVGFALNVQRTEEGIAAFGVAIHNRRGEPLGALAVAVPLARFQDHAQGPLVARMKHIVRDLELEVADIDP